MKITNHDYDLLKLGFEGEQSITNELFYKYGKTYEPKQIIIREGEFGKDVYLIISGKVIVAERLSPCKILVLSPENFEKVFKTHPRWALKILAALTKRIQNAFEQIESYYQGKK